MSFLKKLLGGGQAKTDLFLPPPPPSNEAAAKADSMLGIKFPKSFVGFMQRQRPLKLPPCASFYWIGADTLGMSNIIAANEQEHTVASVPLPKHLVAFYNDGMGNQVCFDTRRLLTDGEYAIVFWDHELTVEENNVAVERSAANFETAGRVADSFQEWFD